MNSITTWGNAQKVIKEKQLLPKFLKHLNKVVPLRLQDTVISPVVNYIFKPGLNAGELDFLTDKWLCIHITDFQHQHFFTVKQQVLKTSHKTQTADAVIKGNFNSFLLLISQQADPDTLFFKRQLQITGNTELALSVKNFLDTIEFDELPMPLRHALLMMANH